MQRGGVMAEHTTRESKLRNNCEKSFSVTPNYACGRKGNAKGINARHIHKHTEIERSNNPLSQGHPQSPNMICQPVVGGCLSPSLARSLTLAQLPTHLADMVCCQVVAFRHLKAALC